MALILNKKSVLTQSSSLKIAQSLKKSVSVKHMIHRELAGWESPRPYHTLHASEVLRDIEFCPREWAFLRMGLAKKRDSFIGTAMRITFDHGRDFENNLRNNWLRKYMVGFWQCGVCGHTHEVFGKSPKIKCPQCGWGHQWGYKEVRLVDPESGVSGGIDGFVDVGDTKLRILELKTMDKDEHKKLLAPLAEHKLRTSLYLTLATKDKASWLDGVGKNAATILYASKSYGFKDESLKEAGISDSPFSPFKEFEIEREDSMVEGALNKAKALTTWQGLHDKGEAAGIPCGICVNGLTKRAQQCSAVGPCWSGSFASTITWMENGVPRHQGKSIIV